MARKRAASRLSSLPQKATRGGTLNEVSINVGTLERAPLHRVFATHWSVHRLDGFGRFRFTWPEHVGQGQEADAGLDIYLNEKALLAAAENMDRIRQQVAELPRMPENPDLGSSAPRLRIVASEQANMSQLSVNDEGATMVFFHLSSDDALRLKFAGPIQKLVRHVATVQLLAGAALPLIDAVLAAVPVQDRGRP